VFDEASVGPTQRLASSLPETKSAPDIAALLRLTVESAAVWRVRM
jgi:hypothetical protein